MADFNAEALAQAAVSTLYEATQSMLVTTPAEYFVCSGGNVTTYYLMIGWDSIVKTSITVWQVTGTPDITGASSGNPTIDGNTIRILKTWTA